MSLLSRGAWIEIFNDGGYGWLSVSRSSHEERGLKSAFSMILINSFASLLSRGAWIEMENYAKAVDMLIVAPLTRSVD